MNCMKPLFLIAMLVCICVPVGAQTNSNAGKVKLTVERARQRFDYESYAKLLALDYRITLKLEDAGMDLIARHLSEQTNQQIEIRPTRTASVDKITIDIKDVAITDIFRFLIDVGYDIVVDGTSFSEMEARRKALDPAEGLFTLAIDGVPVKHVAELLSYVSGKKIRYLGEDKERLIYLSVQKQRLAEIVNLVGATMVEK